MIAPRLGVSTGGLWDLGGPCLWNGEAWVWLSRRTDVDGLRAGFPRGMGVPEFCLSPTHEGWDGMERDGMGWDGMRGCGASRLTMIRCAVFVGWIV